MLRQFDTVRTHLDAALNGDPPQWGAMLPLALSRRYENPEDPDFGRFNAAWRSPAVPDSLRLMAGFALGKASNDVGDFQTAAATFRAANALAHVEHNWSADDWHRRVGTRIATSISLLPAPPAAAIVPVFIVGLPRTGTTLAAEMLGRHPQENNRGELNWISFLDQQLTRGDSLSDRAALLRAAQLSFFICEKATRRHGGSSTRIL